MLFFSVFLCYFVVGPTLAKIELAKVELNISNWPKWELAKVEIGQSRTKPFGRGGGEGRRAKGGGERAGTER